MGWALTPALVVGLAGSPAVTAQAPVACPDAEDKVATQTQGYGKPGASAAYITELEQGDGQPTDPHAIANASFTLTPEDGPPRVTRVELREQTTKIILPAPASGSSFTAVFEWDQNLGTPAACHGRDAYVLPLLPSFATVGEPDLPRVHGRCRIRATPLNYDARVFRRTWRLRARCDYFACDAGLTSSASLRGRLRLRGRGDYSLRSRQGPAGRCRVRKRRKDPATGRLRRVRRTVRSAFRVHTRLTLRATTTRRGVAQTLSGRLTITYRPTPRARRRGCRRVRVERGRITARRL